MKIITVEEHFSDQRIMDADAKYPIADSALPPKMQEMFRAFRFNGEKLLDAGESRLAFMDEQKVDVQVLSYTSPVSDRMPAGEAVEVCAQANDILADVVAGHPDRFAAFATLPMADPVAAARELERCAPLCRRADRRHLAGQILRRSLLLPDL